MISITSQIFDLEAELTIEDPGRYAGSDFGEYSRRISRTATFGGDGNYDVEVEDQGAAEGDRTIRLVINSPTETEIAVAHRLRDLHARVHFAEPQGYYEAGIESVSFNFEFQLNITLLIYRKLS